MNFLSNAFGSQCTIAINLADANTRPLSTIKKPNGTVETAPLFESGDSVSGEVRIEPVVGKRVDHVGVKVELLGQIELYFDRGHFYDFVSLARELAPPGEISSVIKYPFEFSSVEMPYESYEGRHMRLRYIIRVTIHRHYASNIVKDLPLWVQGYTTVDPEENKKIKMEVGIEDCLHIEFEYAKSMYHLKDVVIGKIYFLLVRIKIKHMELEIRRRESSGSGPNTFNENETIAKFKIMDGAPVRGDSIPIRMFLNPYELSPTYKNVNNKFSVKYYLNLVLVDEEDRRYFKQQEIIMYRERPGLAEAAPMAMAVPPPLPPSSAPTPLTASAAAEAPTPSSSSSSS